MRCLFRGCLTLLALIVLTGVGFSVYRSLVKPPRPALLSPSQPAAPSAQGVDARLASTEAAIRQNAAAGRRVPVSLSITDPELAARINEALTRGEVQAPVSDVQVRTVPGQVNISGRLTKFALISVPFTMTAVPRVANSKAQLQVTGIDFGGVPVPEPLAAQLTSLVGTDNLLGDVPLTVTGFRAEAGRLVLEGTT